MQMHLGKRKLSKNTEKLKQKSPVVKEEKKVEEPQAPQAPKVDNQQRLKLRLVKLKKQHNQLHNL